jgi:hypothetical protein
MVIIAMLSLGLITSIVSAVTNPSPPNPAGPIMFPYGDDVPGVPNAWNSSHTHDYILVFPPTHPKWNVSVMVANLTDVLTIAMSVKSLNTSTVNITAWYKGAGFTSLGFSIWTYAKYNGTAASLEGLTAGTMSAIQVGSAPVEMFIIECEGKAFTPISGTVVDIFYQYAGDIHNVKLLQGDCPYDHTVFLNQVIVITQPTAAFTFTPLVPYENDVVTFDNSSSSGGFDGVSLTNITDTQWDFGDGSAVVNFTNPTHSYTTAGSYNVNLTVFTDISPGADPSYIPYASVIHTVTVYATATGRAIDLFTDDWRYGDDGTTYPTTFTGVNPPFPSGSQVDSYSPQDLVYLYAKLTYNGEPICYKEVAFEIHGPPNQYQNITIYRQAVTNGSGIAKIYFRIPWADIPGHAEAITFGAWGAIAKASVANQEVEDVHWWLVHWIVDIVGEHLSPDPVNELSTLYIYVDVHNYALTPRNFTLAVTLYDELNVPVGYTTADLTNIPGGATWNLVVGIYVPEWAYVGVGTVYKDLFTKPPWVCGICFCPEQSDTVYIQGTDPHIPPF